MVIKQTVDAAEQRRKAMDVFLRFRERISGVIRHLMVFGRTHPKKVEAIGLFILLLAGFFQLQADSYQRWITDFRLGEIEGEVSFTRQQVMGLLECQSNGACTHFDHERIKSEVNSFIDLYAPEKFVFWQLVRKTAFALGSCLILIAKWLDGK